MNTVIYISFFGVALAIAISFVRLAKGPTVTDRMLAFEMIAMAVIGIMVLFSCWHQTTIYLEVILIFALLGFLSTLAFVFYLNKSDAGCEAAHDRTVEQSAAPSEKPTSYQP